MIYPFSEMKGEYNAILDNADLANRNKNNVVQSQSFTDPLRETFLKVTNI